MGQIVVVHAQRPRSAADAQRRGQVLGHVLHRPVQQILRGRAGDPLQLERRGHPDEHQRKIGARQRPVDVARRAQLDQSLQAVGDVPVDPLQRHHRRGRAHLRPGRLRLQQHVVGKDHHHALAGHGGIIAVHHAGKHHQQLPRPGRALRLVQPRADPSRPGNHDLEGGVQVVQRR